MHVDINFGMRKRRRQDMNMNDFNLYLLSLEQAIEMNKNGIISYSDLIKLERFLSKKYCIKPNSIYRLNDLIKNENRVSNVSGKE